MDQAFSFVRLLDQFVAIQQLLLVELANLPYEEARKLLPGGSVKYYNKRAGRKALTLEETLILSRYWQYNEAIGVLELLQHCRTNLRQALGKFMPSRIESLPLPPQTINTLIELRSRKAEKWAVEDIRQVLNAIRELHTQLEELLELPDRMSKPAE